MELRKTPVAVNGMLIRRPVSEVYEAFVDPAVTSKFWFTHGSARLDAGNSVTWEWRMYGVSAPVTVKELAKDKRIAIDWGDPATTAEWTFEPMPGNSTFVTIRSFGFSGNADEQVEAAIGSTDGFALVLAGAKAWLEQGVTLGAVGDRHPKGVGG